MSGEQEQQELSLGLSDLPLPANDQTAKTTDQKTTDQWRTVGEFEATALLIVEASKSKAPSERLAYLIDEFVSLAREADIEAEKMAGIVLDDDRLD